MTFAEIKKDIPNTLTILRIVLIPVLILSFYLEGQLSNWVAAIIFAFASLTDYFDGLLARRFNAHTSFGRMFDPIADKLLVAATLVMLVHTNKVHVVPAILILCREITVSGLREYLAAFKFSMPVTRLAKVKTGIQMLAIIILLLGEEATGWPHVDFIGNIAIWLAAALTLVTGYAYLREGLKRAL